ncbi:MAG: transcriptional regulator, LuxR family, partial [Solirubrobacterales bacterium]|nr:transcriptional regulator, LuxR family [Solirubrobacterales bacterium]
MAHAISAGVTVGSLLERDRELAALTALVGEAAAGQARLVLIEGPRGIGKTRLLGEAREWAAADGFRVLHGRGGLERELAFGLVRQLFEASVVADPERLLAGPAAPARSVFGRGEAPEDPSFAVLHGLYWLTVNLAAGGPLLLAVDDLHWCDSASVRFLGYLVRRLEGLRVLVACCVRATEPTDAILAQLAADPLARSVKPRALSDTAVAELLGRQLHAVPDEAFATECRVLTGGNPLLLDRLLRALGEECMRPDVAHVQAVAEVGARAVCPLLPPLPG